MWAIQKPGDVAMDAPFAVVGAQGMVVNVTFSSKNDDWVETANVKVKGMGDARRATLATTSERVEIGSIEKMSKSKKNTIDPDDIIEAYGADTARWFMLSDSPPERDVIWTEEGVQGAYRFGQRLWRLTGDLSELMAVAGAPRPAQFNPPALAVRDSNRSRSTSPGAGNNGALSGSRWPVAFGAVGEYDLIHLKVLAPHLKFGVGPLPTAPGVPTGANAFPGGNLFLLPTKAAHPIVLARVARPSAPRPNWSAT